MGSQTQHPSQFNSTIMMIFKLNNKDLPKIDSPLLQYFTLSSMQLRILDASALHQLWCLSLSDHGFLKIVPRLGF